MVAWTKGVRPREMAPHQSLCPLDTKVISAVLNLVRHGGKTHTSGSSEVTAHEGIFQTRGRGNNTQRDHVTDESISMREQARLTRAVHASQEQE